MGRFVSTIVLLVVLGGLVGYIYFVDSTRAPDEIDVKPKAFEVSADNIEEVSIRTAGGEAGRVQRSGATWQLVEPQKAEADSTALASMTSSLARLDIQRVVDESPADLTQYGLNPPRVEVAFRVKDQKEFQRLLIGENTPTGGDLYAKKPDENRVFLISSSVESVFNKTPFELRDRSVLTFDRDKIDGFEIVNGPATYQFSKDGINWRLVKPVASRAEFSVVEGLLTRLSSLLMQKIVAAEPRDLRPYGLDRPRLSVSVSTGGSRATLLAGRSDAGAVFAKDASRPIVFTIEEAFVNDAASDLNEFRRRDMFDGRSFTANRLEITRGDRKAAFEKTEADGKTTWRNSVGQEVDTALVEDAITKLANVRAVSFSAGPGTVRMPALTVTLRFDDDKAETVMIGPVGTRVLASRPDEQMLATIDQKIFDDASRAVDTLMK
jgi:hypothetical protein